MPVDSGNAINVISAVQNTYSGRTVYTYGPYGGDGVSLGQFNANMLVGLTGGGMLSAGGNCYVDIGRPCIIQYMDVYLPSGYLSTINASGALTYASTDAASTDPPNAPISWEDPMDAPTSTNIGNNIMRCRWTPTTHAKIRWIRLTTTGPAFLYSVEAYGADAAASGLDESGIMAIGLSSGVPGTRNSNYNYLGVLGDVSVGSETDPLQMWVVNTGSGDLYGSTVYVVHQNTTTQTTDYYGESALYVAAGSGGPWSKSVVVPSGANAGVIESGSSAAFWVKFVPTSGTPDGALSAYLRCSAYRTNL